MLLAARPSADLTRLASEVEGAIAIPADLSSSTGIEGLTGAVIAAIGGAPDVLVNNAGRFPMGPIETVADDELEGALALNIAAPLRLARAFLPAMRVRGSGHLITIGSVADRQTFAGNAVYAATKFAARAIHETTREETRGTGIRATLIAPAATDTGLWDAHDREGATGLPSRTQMLAAEDVAEAVRWVVTRPAHVTIDELRLSRS